MDYDIDESVLEYFDAMDGELFGIQTRSSDQSYPIHQIIMTRKIALEMAHDIIEFFGEDEQL